MAAGFRKWRIPFNKHFYVDCSDRPQSGVLVIGASDAEWAWQRAVETREACADSGLSGKGTRRFWIGNIHRAAITPA